MVSKVEKVVGMVEEILNVGNVLLPHPAIHPSGGERLTKQSEAADADINNIMKKWEQGLLPRFSSGQPSYGDFSSGDSYYEAMNRVMDAEEEFMALPAKVRDHCENDPGKFLELVQNPENLVKLKDLGLLPGDVPEFIQKVEVVNPPQGDKPAQSVT